jgi:DNA-binding response OmpR family regulator
MGTYAFDPSRAMVVEIGCDDFLQKPVTRFKLSLLLARIKISSTIPTPALLDTPPKLAGYHLLYAEDSLPSQVNPEPFTLAKRKSSIDRKLKALTLNVPFTLNPKILNSETPNPETLNATH